jgi:hypothetical protein
MRRMALVNMIKATSRRRLIVAGSRGDLHGPDQRRNQPTVGLPFKKKSGREGKHMAFQTAGSGTSRPWFSVLEAFGVASGAP